MQDYKFNKLYDELVLLCEELTQYYDIDKIKSYSVYVWDKELEENVFDIMSDELIFYVDEHVVIYEAMKIIRKIQVKLNEISEVYN